MLLLWSGDYLDRLWCIYEATSFLQFHASDALLFIPVHRAAALLLLFALNAARAILTVSYGLWTEDIVGEKPRIGRLMLFTDALVYLTCYVYFLAGLRHAREWQRQLQAVSVRAALCSVEGDRALIHQSIADSHSAAALLSGAPPPFSRDSSLDVFDGDAHARLGETLGRAVSGPQALLPYAQALFVAQPAAWVLMDRAAFAPRDQAARLALLALVRVALFTPLSLRLWQMAAASAAGLEERLGAPWLALATAASALAVLLDALLSRAVGGFFLRAGSSTVAVCAASAALAAITAALFVPRKQCEREVRLGTPPVASPGYSTLLETPAASPFSREPAEETGFADLEPMD